VDQLKANYRAPINSVDHAVVVCGFYDDATCPTGGYWVIKNSWGDTAGDGTGYYYAPYGSIENHNTIDAMTGAVYYTGAMTTATWNGGAGGWSNGGTNWSSGYAWENKETSAIFAGLTKTVALELATHKITVNCISPGYVWTPLVEKQIPDTMKARGLTREQVIHDVLLDAQPTKEFVTSEQVAALALFLCGDDAAQSIAGNSLGHLHGDGGARREHLRQPQVAVREVWIGAQPVDDQDHADGTLAHQERHPQSGVDSGFLRDLRVQPRVVTRVDALAPTLLERLPELRVPPRNPQFEDSFTSLAVGGREAKLVLAGRYPDRYQACSQQLAQALADELQQTAQIGLAHQGVPDLVQRLELRRPPGLRLVEARVLDCDGGLVGQCPQKLVVFGAEQLAASLAAELEIAENRAPDHDRRAQASRRARAELGRRTARVAHPVADGARGNVVRLGRDLQQSLAGTGQPGGGFNQPGQHAFECPAERRVRRERHPLVGQGRPGQLKGVEVHTHREGVVEALDGLGGHGVEIVDGGHRILRLQACGQREEAEALDGQGGPLHHRGIQEGVPGHDVSSLD